MLAATGCIDELDMPGTTAGIGMLFSLDDVLDGNQPACFAGQFAFDSVDI